MVKKLWLRMFFLSYALIASPVHAQSAPASAAAGPGTKLPVYDVVVIKPNKSGNGSVNVDSDFDYFKASNVSLRRLLQSAYGIKENLISGIPAEVNSVKFDVQAKVVDPDMNALKKLNGEQLQEMLREVLFDRFQLKAHVVMKVLPVYELAQAKDGPKFKPSVDHGQNDAGTSIRGGRSNVKLTAHDVTMTSFADSLHRHLDRAVVDKTGLSGKYDLSLQWSNDDLSGADSGPSIFTALQEQLGLKLRAPKDQSRRSSSTT